ncbi:uncharacterized protein LOC115577798 isoform X2 [Sparus aurata]|uniref:uncharacterized protein LOC115577798 isoform X2 n=1 Tax=Sparus aurata TaxID=8175 RepID=UPI0011C157D8|nr:uncharacterized protein LOC115577798 isoform X2 [Sparus aurata]
MSAVRTQTERRRRLILQIHIKLDRKDGRQTTQDFCKSRKRRCFTGRNVTKSREDGRFSKYSCVSERKVFFGGTSWS